MKTIFTLVCALGLITAVQAQDRRGDNRDDRQPEPGINWPTDQRGFDRGYSNDQYDKDIRFMKVNPGMHRKIAKQLAAIDREFDYKIQRVRNNFYMSRWEKQRQVRFLEMQRQQEIRRVYARFHYSRNRQDDRFDHRY